MVAAERVKKPGSRAHACGLRKGQLKVQIYRCEREIGVLFDDVEGLGG